MCPPTPKSCQPRILHPLEMPWNILVKQSLKHAKSEWLSHQQTRTMRIRGVPQAEGRGCQMAIQNCTKEWSTLEIATARCCISYPPCLKISKRFFMHCEVYSRSLTRSPRETVCQYCSTSSQSLFVLTHQRERKPMCDRMVWWWQLLKSTFFSTADEG